MNAAYGSPLSHSATSKRGKAIQNMHSHSLSVLAGFVSSTIFISSNLPMLFKALKTKDLSSYSPWHLTLGTLGNTIYWLYVISLPIGPVWLLQAFFTMASSSMLFAICAMKRSGSAFRKIKSPKQNGLSDLKP